MNELRIDDILVRTKTGLLHCILEGIEDFYKEDMFAKSGKYKQMFIMSVLLNPSEEFSYYIFFEVLLQKTIFVPYVSKVNNFLHCTIDTKNKNHKIYYRYNEQEVQYSNILRLVLIEMLNDLK